MRSTPAFLIAIMCLSLLALQMSGLHLHVTTDSPQSGAVHGTHLHDMDHDGHEHGADADISPFESATTPWLKLIPFLVTLVFALLTAIWTRKTVWQLLVERLPVRRHFRWRPPLRAPPEHSL